MFSNILFVVQFYPWFKFYFLLFLGIVVYDNEFEQRKIEFEPRIKLNHNILVYITGEESRPSSNVELHKTQTRMGELSPC